MVVVIIAVGVAVIVVALAVGGVVARRWERRKARRRQGDPGNMTVEELDEWICRCSDEGEREN